MERHLILVDLDGTLLNNDGKISEFNKLAIKKLKEHGHEVVIVTGRAHYRSSLFYDELGLDSLFVNRNGSYIHHPKNEAYQETINYITKDALSRLTKSPMINNAVSLYGEHKNTIYVVKGKSDFYQKYSCELIENHYSEWEHINLISMHVLGKDVEKVKEYLNTIPELYYEVFLPSGEFTNALFQIYPHCDKAYSIPVLSDYYKVPNERIIAFGDGLNDIGMIEKAGIGIAMNNAIEEVKNVSKIVLDESNHESGVGQFLNQYFNLNLNLKMNNE